MNIDNSSLSGLVCLSISFPLISGPPQGEIFSITPSGQVGMQQAPSWRLQDSAANGTGLQGRYMTLAGCIYPFIP